MSRRESRTEDSTRRARTGPGCRKVRVACCCEASSGNKSKWVRAGCVSCQPLIKQLRVQRYTAERKMPECAKHLRGSWCAAIARQSCNDLEGLIVDNQKQIGKCDDVRSKPRREQGCAAKLISISLTQTHQPPWRAVSSLYNCSSS